jgi:hypothetical protein
MVMDKYWQTTSTTKTTKKGGAKRRDFFGEVHEYCSGMNNVMPTGNQLQK